MLNEAGAGRIRRVSVRLVSRPISMDAPAVSARELEVVWVSHKAAVDWRNPKSNSGSVDRRPHAYGATHVGMEATLVVQGGAHKLSRGLSSKDEIARLPTTWVALPCWQHAWHKVSRCISYIV